MLSLQASLVSDEDEEGQRGFSKHLWPGASLATESRTRRTKRSGEIPSGHNLVDDVDGSLRSIAKRYAVILHVVPSYWGMTGMTINCQHLPVISSYFDVICKCC